ncbi:MAG: ribbon-helix-helix protein, CopG family [Nitrosospira sp.]
MTQSVSIRLDDDVLSKLDMLTKATERSRAWLMAHAVEQYVQHEAWQIEAIQNTLDKIRQGNSKFAGEEQTEQWLQSWGSGQELKAPVCK